MRYFFEDCALDTDRRELRRQNGLVSIEPQVFDLIEFLIRNREHVVSRDDLIAAIWVGRIVSESALSTRINAARAAIGDTGEQQRLIKTFPRKGVRFVCAVQEEEAATAVAAGVPGKVPFILPDKPSIAVLPFTNMSGDPEQTYFADGMAEEIITSLSRCNWLFVIARNSSFTYKDKTVDVRQVGRELGVRYVMEGSVRRAYDRLRILGQLVDATTGAHIWADRFDGEMSDVFDLQDRIAESVVAAIEPRLQLAEIERLKRRPPANLDAYDLVLRAQQLEYEFTAESLAAALHCLEQALAIDPFYAPALGLAAFCHAQRCVQGWAKDPKVETSKGLRFAERAIELAKDHSNVLWMAAYAIRELGMDPHRAKDVVYRSLHLNPNSAIALTIAAWIEAPLPNPGKALQLLQRAERLSPRDPRAWFMATAAALAHFVDGAYDQSALFAKKALAQNPRFAIALRLLAASLAKTGELDQAAETMKKVLEIEPQLTASKLRARLPFMPQSIWTNLAEGLRLAGLPE
ncbi:MAG: winged helix-turn-helix domain-containing protein [Burkholderiales bacterium]